MKRLAKGILLCLITAYLVIFMNGLSSGASDVPALRDAKDPAERTRTQTLIDGASKEGKLVWATNMIPAEMTDHLMKGFKAYYGLSNLAVEFTNVGSGAIVSRVEELLQSGRPPHDVIWYGSWAFYKSLLARGHIMRYESPNYKYYTISNQIGNSMPGYWVSDSYTFHPMWNPAALAKAGIKDFNPTSYWDIADPKFAGLLSLSNFPQTQTDSLVAMGWRKVLGDEWFKKMAKLKAGFFTRQTQARDWVVSGEYPICATGGAQWAITAKAAGAPVKLLYPKEGVVLLPYAPIILAKAQHPNVAKLFIDYTRSEAGTNRLAETPVGLVYGRPGVKVNPAEREFLPPVEEIKKIPMDWNTVATPEAVAEFQKWTISIGLCQ